MKFLAFDKSGQPTIGVRRNQEVVDLSVAAPSLPRDMPGLLAAGKAAMDAVSKAVASPPSGSVLPGANIVYHPAIWNPGKIICVGLNYADHAKESGLKKPDYPVLFLRVNTTLVGHGQPLIAPRCSEQFDYEAEMVVVIGKGGRNIGAAKALDHVAGYSVFNEGSLRDYQFKSQTWTSGKNFDATGGFGPDIVTADEVAAGGDGLRLQARLNGKVLQDGNTNDMMFKVPELIETISEVMTLLPGDIIVSGTPAGVGFARKPPVWMKPGDVCEIELEGVGLLSNPIKAE
jgi:2-keto-4-pentenoate hydratase/2-oxohepta-3-ene-1,7-dioic acid hydratase in catechol pathway